MFAALRSSKLTYVILFTYLLLVGWWITIYLSGVKDSPENFYFGLAYAQIALIGGINGVLIAKKWGGFKSLMGRGISFLGLGLLSYWFGQTAWSFYNIVLHVEIPYPSIADIGYFSSIICYFLGMYFIAKTAGANVALQRLKGKLIALLIPFTILSLSYYFFMRETALDFSNPIRTFLDFGTPVGYAITISTAIVAFLLTRGILGGKMASRILFIIFAMVAEYVTDYTFLFQYAAGTYYNAGINDLMFATTFTLMALGLIGFRSYE